MINYEIEIPKAYILSVHNKSQELEQTLDSLREMKALAITMGFEVVGEDYQSRPAPDPKSYMGIGKLAEVKSVVEEYGVTLILFDHDLSPKQGQFLERFLECMVWDRTQLILEIFANHARTPEARDQVELAQLQYMLPRLVGLWAHLDREKGGIGASRGTGEKQINIDRNLIRNRIFKLERSLKKVSQERKTQSKQRSNCFQVAVVGYTNAGKSSLMNQLTGASLLSQDKLFATLESTTRILKDSTNPTILLSDTVGFIRNLPHNLVASFRSTLSVVLDADLLLHVVDGSSPNIDQHIQTTERVLSEIGADKIPYLLVFNKMDLVTEKMDQLILSRAYPGSILASSLDESAVENLRATIKQHFLKSFVREECRITYDRTDLLAKFYALCTVEQVRYEEDGIYITHQATQTNYQILSSLLETTRGAS